ncbi:MAG TPA: dihydrolipoamide acetyltransferase family protein [Stellaceae bacterium]|nr:dihydrolipoamide acetyltransferase family protein [Stellaceae bacterium]
MAQRIVKMPDIGEGTTEAEIVSWLVKVGDIVTEEDPLAEVMTDKATVEIPSPVGGKIVALNGKPGEKLPVGSDLVVLEVAGAAPVAEPGAPRSTPAASPHPPSAAPTVPPLPQAGEGKNGRIAPVQKPLSRGAGEGGETQAKARGEAGEGPRAPRPSGLSGHRPLASPAVRQQAWDLGIDLQFVPGTGPGGRVTHEDIAAYAASAGSQQTVRAPALARRDGVEDIPVIGLRRAIAEHLQEAWRHIPHFAYVEEIDVTALEELRAHLNQTRAERGHLTLLPLLIRAIVNSIVDHPQVNARYDDEAGVLHRHNAAHIGVATQTPGGLMVPVVHHAEALDLWQAAAEIQRLSEAARTGKATREELTGSTITITSLGPLGGLMATPVINHPEVAIIGVNRIVERPVVKAGQIVVRKVMNISSSFDHRIVDGWEAASFIAKIKGYLEQPATLFLD